MMQLPTMRWMLLVATDCPAFGCPLDGCTSHSPTQKSNCLCSGRYAQGRDNLSARTITSLNRTSLPRLARLGSLPICAACPAGSPALNDLFSHSNALSLSLIFAYAE